MSFDKDHVGCFWTSGRPLWRSFLTRDSLRTSLSPMDRCTEGRGDADLLPGLENVGSGFANLRPRHRPRSSGVVRVDDCEALRPTLAMSSTHREV